MTNHYNCKWRVTTTVQNITRITLMLLSSHTNNTDSLQTLYDHCAAANITATNQNFHRETKKQRVTILSTEINNDQIPQVFRQKIMKSKNIIKNIQNMSKFDRKFKKKHSSNASILPNADINKWPVITFGIFITEIKITNKNLHKCHILPQPKAFLILLTNE